MKSCCRVFALYRQLKENNFVRKQADGKKEASVARKKKDGMKVKEKVQKFFNTTRKGDQAVDDMDSA